MRAYKLTVFVIDHEGMGGAEIASTIENTKYPNYCISPDVKNVEGVDIGYWDDDHPLNKKDTADREYKRLFSLTDMREKLADLCHRQWSGWMRYLFDRTTKCGKAASLIDRSVMIHSDDVERWQRQMETPYERLSEAEKNSDRKEADKFIALLGGNHE